MFDDEAVVSILRETIVRSGSRLRRISMCRRGSAPLIVSEVLVDPISQGSASVLWDGLVSFFSGEDTAVVLPRGAGVGLATVAPGVVLIGEFDRYHQLGVATVLVRRAADEILEKAIIDGGRDGGRRPDSG